MPIMITYSGNRWCSFKFIACATLCFILQGKSLLARHSSSSIFLQLGSRQTPLPLSLSPSPPVLPWFQAFSGRLQGMGSSQRPKESSRRSGAVAIAWTPGPAFVGALASVGPKHSRADGNSRTVPSLEHGERSGTDAHEPAPCLANPPLAFLCIGRVRADANAGASHQNITARLVHC